MLLKCLGQRVLSVRCLQMASSLRLRKVVEKEEGSTITFEGMKVESDRKHKLLTIPSTVSEHSCSSCPLCRLNMVLSFRDVLILQQFMRADGTILPRQITGICYKQQETVVRLVQQAHYSGLFSHFKSEIGQENAYKNLKRQWTHNSDLYTSKYDERPGSFHFIRRYE